MMVGLRPWTPSFQHYNACMNLGLSAQQQSDLVEVLKSP